MSLYFTFLFLDAVEKGTDQLRSVDIVVETRAQYLHIKVTAIPGMRALRQGDGRALGLFQAWRIFRVLGVSFPNQLRHIDGSC